MMHYLFALIFYSLAVKILILIPQVTDQSLKSLGATVASFTFMIGTYEMIRAYSKKASEKKSPQQTPTSV